MPRVAITTERQAATIATVALPPHLPVPFRLALAPSSQTAHKRELLEWPQSAQVSQAMDAT